MPIEIGFSLITMRLLLLILGIIDSKTTGVETVKKVEPRPNKGQTRRLPKARTTGASIIGQEKFLYFASIDHALVRDGTQQIQTLLDAIEGKAGTRR